MGAEAVLETRNLKVYYPIGRSFRDAVRGQAPEYVAAVDGVSLTIAEGETLAIVGESGSGKTTLAKAILGLEDVAAARISGSILVDGKPLDWSNSRAHDGSRRRIQMIYQDPYESLNPRFTIGRSVGEVLDIHRVGTRADRKAMIADALTTARLTPPQAYVDRHPHQLSGGQRQRVAIASALVAGPRILIADEPVSMLDVTMRAGILGILRDLQATGVAMMVITHDLSTIAGFADRVAVMYRGQIVEAGPTAEVLSNPRHSYTRALIAAVPKVKPIGVRSDISTAARPTREDHRNSKDLRA